MTIEFFVPGVPAPGGSKKGFVNPKTGHVVIVDDCTRNKDWRTTVSTVAFEYMQRLGIKEPFRCPIRVSVRFFLPRPKGHYTGAKPESGILRRGAPQQHTIRPDATKLWRSTEDALRMIAWCDDAQVVSQHVMKCYTTPDAKLYPHYDKILSSAPGARIRIVAEAG